MAVIYISPTGNDTTGNGTSGTPYLTISKAYTVASANDTIYCLDGTYTMVSQSIGKVGITITGSSPENVIFDGGGVGAVWKVSAVSPFSVSNIHFQNLDFSTLVNVGGQNFGSPIAGFQYGDNTNIYVINVTNCIFNDILVKDGDYNGGGLVSIAYGGNGQQINAIGNKIYDITKYSSSAGQLFYNTSATCTYTLLNNSISITGSGNALLSRIVNGSNLGTAKNNIFRTVNAMPLTSGITWTYQNNCAYNFTSVPSGTNNITTDPLFVDYTNGNLKLRPTSPCRDTGVAL